MHHHSHDDRIEEQKDWDWQGFVGALAFLGFMYGLMFGAFYFFKIFGLVGGHG